jgi:hypothetical protein
MQREYLNQYSPGQSINDCYIGSDFFNCATVFHQENDEFA